MYRIVGADGRQYGPVSVEQLRRWIAEGRANAQTLVFADGGTEWKPLAALPEFAGHFMTQAPPPIGARWPDTATTSSFATAGFVCGLASLVMCCCCGGFPFNILGLVFSIIALVRIKEEPARFKGHGLAIAGLVFSAISLLVVLFTLASGHTNIILNDRIIR